MQLCEKYATTCETHANTEHHQKTYAAHLFMYKYITLHLFHCRHKTSTKDLRCTFIYTQGYNIEFAPRPTHNICRRYPVMSCDSFLMLSLLATGTTQVIFRIFALFCVILKYFCTISRQSLSVIG